MIIERALNAQYLSNTYLVCDRDGGGAVVIDAGGPLDPVFKAAERLSVAPSMVLLTHHHHDHVSEVPGLTARWADVPVLISPLERDDVPTSTGTVDAGDRLTAGDLVIRPLAHAGSYARNALVPRRARRVGRRLHRRHPLPRLRGRCARPWPHDLPGDQGLDHGDAMELDPATEIHPGHSEPTTVGREWDATRSSASGGASTARAHSPASRSAIRRR